MRIYLIGYMGSGKSTVSGRLAAQLGFQRLDLDELFEEHYKIPIHRFFEKYDQTVFRTFESRLLKETESIDNVVISTGGGTPCYYDNMFWMNQHGLTVYLKISAGAIASRLSQSKKKRPLLAQKKPDELLGFVREHLRQRNIYYSQAKITIQAESIDLNELVRLVRQYQ